MSQPLLRVAKQHTNLRESDPSVPVPIPLLMRPRHCQRHADEAHEEDETNLQYFKHSQWKLEHFYFPCSFCFVLTFISVCVYSYMCLSTLSPIRILNRSASCSHCMPVGIKTPGGDGKEDKPEAFFPLVAGWVSLSCERRSMGLPELKEVRSALS